MDKKREEIKNSVFIKYYKISKWKKVKEWFRKKWSKNKKDIDKEAVKLFNKETKDGYKMNKYSELLSNTIKSIIEVKNENELDAIISGKDFSFFAEQIDGLDDFELISFLVVE